MMIIENSFSRCTCNRECLCWPLVCRCLIVKRYSTLRSGHPASAEPRPQMNRRESASKPAFTFAGPYTTFPTTTRDDAWEGVGDCILRLCLAASSCSFVPDLHIRSSPAFSAIVTQRSPTSLYLSLHACAPSAFARIATRQHGRQRPHLRSHPRQEEKD